MPTTRNVRGLIFSIFLYNCHVIIGRDLEGLMSLYNNPKNYQCEDKSKMLPDCVQCITGITSKDGQCILSPETISMRENIKKLTRQRFSNPLTPYDLYPYLREPDFVRRQVIFGQQIEKLKPSHIVDIGSYYNPINLFIGHHCPKSVTIVEPILDPLSTYLPCTNSSEKTHLLILPLIVKSYFRIIKTLPPPDCVVCIGCDGDFGPKKHELLAFTKPYVLFLEFPFDYHSSYAQFYSLNSSATSVLFELLYIVPEETRGKTAFFRRFMRTLEFKDSSSSQSPHMMTFISSILKKVASKEYVIPLESPPVAAYRMMLRSKLKKPLISPTIETFRGRLAQNISALASLTSNGNEVMRAHLHIPPNWHFAYSKER